MYFLTHIHIFTLWHHLNLAICCHACRMSEVKDQTNSAQYDRLIIMNCNCSDLLEIAINHSIVTILSPFQPCHKKTTTEKADVREKGIHSIRLIQEDRINRVYTCSDQSLPLRGDYCLLYNKNAHAIYRDCFFFFFVFFFLFFFFLFFFQKQKLKTLENV